MTGRTRTHRPVWLLVVPVLLALVLTACGSSSSTPSSAGGASPKSFGVNATGTVTVWYRSGFAALFKILAKDFNATHKNLKVDAVPVSDTDYITKLATAIRAGTAPDLASLDDVDSEIFISKNEFMNVTKYVNSLPYKGKLSPGALHLATKSGKYYGVPDFADMSVLWYNKSLFAKAGLDPNKPPTNFAQILTDAKKIRALGSTDYGFSFAGDCPGCLTFTVLPNVYAAGADVLKGSPGAQKATIAGNKPLEATLQLYQHLWSQGLVPKADQTQSGTTWGSDFLSGDIGMLPAGYGAVGPKLTGKTASEVGLAPLPGPHGGYSTYDGGANFGIPASSKNPSGAWEFVKYALSLPAQQLTPLGGVEPIRSDALTPAFQKRFPLVAQIAGYLNHGNAPYTVAHDALFNLVSQPWQEMFNTAVYNGDVPKALTQGQSGFTSVLESLQS
jgi:multiple sugar transport system substrate-binding protein